MAEFKNYSFTNVNVIFGILEITGFAEGDDVVNVVQEADQFNDLAGAKGDVVRSQSNDNRCTITVKILQNSISNKELNTLYLADKEAGTGVLPMMIEDKETGESYVINNSWISKFPDIVRGQGVGVMEWTFRGDFFTPVIT